MRIFSVRVQSSSSPLLDSDFFFLSTRHHLGWHTRLSQFLIYRTITWYCTLSFAKQRPWESQNQRGSVCTLWSSTSSRARSCTWVRAIPGTNTGWGMSGLRAALQRRTWGCWWMKNWIWASNVCLQPRKPIASWAASKEAWPAGRGRWFSPSTLLLWDPTWNTESSSGTPSVRKTWTC